MKLARFVQILKEKSDEFEAYWEAQRSKVLPQEKDYTWPVEMKSVDWQEQFNAWLSMEGKNNDNT